MNINLTKKDLAHLKKDAADEWSKFKQAKKKECQMNEAILVAHTIERLLHKAAQCHTDAALKEDGPLYEGAAIALIAGYKKHHKEMIEHISAFHKADAELVKKKFKHSMNVWKQLLNIEAECNMKKETN